MHTHTHTHTHIYIYIYTCARVWGEEEEEEEEGDLPDKGTQTDGRTGEFAFSLGAVFERGAIALFELFLGRSLLDAIRVPHGHGDESGEPEY